MLNRLCCMRLNTAGLVIGWLGGVISLFSVIILSVGLGFADRLAKSITDGTEADADSIRVVIIIFCSFYLAVSLINLVSSVLLVMGTVKERHLLLVPWLLNSGFSLLINVLYIIVYTVAAIKGHAPVGTILGCLISFAIPLAIQWYIWYAIYSLFKTLQQARQNQQLLHPTGSTGPTNTPYTKI